MFNWKGFLAQRLEERDYKSYNDTKNEENRAQVNVKAKKILSFAWPIIQELARLKGESAYQSKEPKECHYKGCDAYFTVVETKNRVLWTKRINDPFIIAVGARSRHAWVQDLGTIFVYGAPLIVNNREFGRDEALDQINEMWFVDILANEYVWERHKPWRGWR